MVSQFAYIQLICAVDPGRFRSRKSVELLPNPYVIRRIIANIIIVIIMTSTISYGFIFVYIMRLDWFLFAAATKFKHNHSTFTDRHQHTQRNMKLDWREENDSKFVISGAG